MNKTNELVICKDRYNDEYEFEDAIKTAVMLLLQNNYIMTIKYDEPGLGIVVIDYEYDDQSFGCHYPYWLLPEEAEKLYVDLNNEEDENDSTSSEIF